MTRRPGAPSTAARAALRVLGAGVLAAALSLGLSLSGLLRPALRASPEVGPRWSEEVLAKAALLPVQEGGRVKPLDTYADYTLKRINARASAKDLDGNTLTALEWLLDALLRPEQARRYECVAVDNDEVLDAVGLAHEGKKKRDRYAFDTLQPALERLRALARQYHDIPEKERSPVQAGVVELAADLGLFEALLGFTDFARPTVAVPALPRLQALWPGRERVTAVEVVEQVAALRGLMASGGDPHGAGAGAGADPHGGAAASPEAAAAERLVTEAVHAFEAATLLNLVPPGDKTLREWRTPGEVLFLSARGEAVAPAEAAIVGHLAALARAPNDGLAAARELTALHSAAVELASQRGEYHKVPLEVQLHRWDFFNRALLGYLVALLALVVSWLAPWRWPKAVAWGALLLAVGLHLAGIVVRCILRDRPPISTLYDTTLSIAAGAALALIVAEWLTRKGIALALAPLVAGLILLVGQRFDLLKAEDSMPPLEAVLDTNFYLMLHVTAISLGYMAGLVASAVAHVHVLGRTLGVRERLDYTLLNRLTYGMLIVALFLSVVGTILGGIWANVSWGRFWGWDPKENGALMICLAQLAILHGRLGGLLKPFGVAMATIAQGGVIVFSWWGVNLLGIGLHSYGFTGGIFTALMWFYAVEALVLLVGGVHWFLGRQAAAPTQP